MESADRGQRAVVAARFLEHAHRFAHRVPFGVDRHRFLARIDAGGIEPDGAQEVAGRKLAVADERIACQRIEADAVVLLIGEEAVTAPIAGPIEVQLERATNIGHDQERWRAGEHNSSRRSCADREKLGTGGV